MDRIWYGFSIDFSPRERREKETAIILSNTVSIANMVQYNNISNANDVTFDPVFFSTLFATTVMTSTNVFPFCDFYHPALDIELLAVLNLNMVMIAMILNQQTLLAFKTIWCNALGGSTGCFRCKCHGTTNL